MPTPFADRTFWTRANRIPTGGPRGVPLGAPDECAVTNDEYGSRGDNHEGDGCHQRARREICETAHTVSAGTPRAQARAEAHEQPRQGEQRQPLCKYDE